MACARTSLYILSTLCRAEKHDAVMNTMLSNMSKIDKTIGEVRVLYLALPFANDAVTPKNLRRFAGAEFEGLAGLLSALPEEN